MSRFYSIFALASLTLHVAVLSMFPVSASDTNCSPSPGSGCSCQSYACNVQNPQNLSCVAGFTSCTNSNGCYAVGSFPGSFEVDAGANATVCVSTGPLVGAGCSHGFTSYCKKTRTCVCDNFAHCDPSDVESGAYFPCTQNP
jgi:hypothetical protein